MLHKEGQLQFMLTSVFVFQTIHFCLPNVKVLEKVLENGLPHPWKCLISFHVNVYELVSGRVIGRNSILC